MRDDLQLPSDEAARRRLFLISPFLMVPVLLAFIAFGQLLPHALRSFGFVLSELLIFFGLSYAVLRALGYDALRTSGLQPFRPKDLAAGFAFGAANYVGWIIPINVLSQAVFPKQLLERFDQSQIFAGHSPAQLALVTLSVSLVAPVCEEFFFRGVLQRAFIGLTEGPRGVVLAAIVFAAFHVNPVVFFGLLQLGVLFGLLSWRTGSLWASIGAHAANNIVSTALFALSDGDANDTLPVGLTLAFFIAGNVALVALLRRRESLLPARDVTPESGTDSPRSEGPPSLS